MPDGEVRQLAARVDERDDERGAISRIDVDDRRTGADFRRIEPHGITLAKVVVDASDVAVAHGLVAWHVGAVFCSSDLGELLDAEDFPLV